MELGNKERVWFRDYTSNAHKMLFSPEFPMIPDLEDMQEEQLAGQVAAPPRYIACCVCVCVTRAFTIDLS